MRPTATRRVGGATRAVRIAPPAAPRIRPFSASGKRLLPLGGALSGLAPADAQLVPVRLHVDDATLGHAPRDQRPRDPGLHLTLDEATQRPGAVHRVVPRAGDQRP